LPKAFDVGNIKQPVREQDGTAARGNAHAALRLQTRDLHSAVESRLVLSNLATRAGYVDYLLFNWACAPIELALEHAGISNVLLDWDRRRRRIALVTDLDALGVPTPSCCALTIDSDIGSLLGWSYVLEGSRLGARVILQTVIRSPEPEVRCALAFLRHGDGEHLWGTFKDELRKIDRDPAAIAKACACANAAFRCFASLPEQ
jgi:heme oxygenase